MLRRIWTGPNGLVPLRAWRHSDTLDTCKASPDTFKGDDDWSNFTPKVGIQYLLNDYTQFYGSWSRGAVHSSRVRAEFKDAGTEFEAAGRGVGGKRL